MTSLANSIDKLLSKICKFFLWGNLLLVFVITLQVICRYFFNFTSAAFEELQWHLFAVSMLNGIAYAILTDAHVKADILYGKFSERKKQWVDLSAMLLFVIPFFAYIFFKSLPFIDRSFAVSESSSNPGGLPYRWLIKSFIPFSALLIIAAATSKAFRLSDLLRGKDAS
ncbi:MAG: TRAP transporter small permease subunit [Lentisphaeraceae bacterium]|nr:TRAP transporter small permease subunit [Lentisphaeraceae bacterium]